MQAFRFCPARGNCVAAPDVEIFVRHTQGQIPKLQRRPVLAYIKKKREMKKVWEEDRKKRWGDYEVTQGRKETGNYAEETFLILSENTEDFTATVHDMLWGIGASHNDFRIGHCWMMHLYKTAASWSDKRTITVFHLVNRNERETASPPLGLFVL